MKYKDFTTEDFLQDEFFIKWVKDPNPESDYFWKMWMDNHPEKAGKVAAAKEIILSIQYKNNFQSTDADLLEVLENIHKGKWSGRSEDTLIRRIPLPVLLKYAAVFLIFSAIAVGSWQYVQRNNPEQPQLAGQQALLIQKQTLKGQKLQVILPDGSHVKLNSESKIIYDSEFGHANRNVKLIGEAFFDVTHDPSRPFIIQTENLKTTVLGTSFNINAYPENVEIKVAVLRGKVGVSSQLPQNEEKQRLLLPNEMLTYEKNNGDSRKEVIDVKDVFAWKDDILFFRNADYKEIKETLERWYSVTFVAEPGLNIKEEFSGKFENTSLERVLDALNYTSNFQYQLKDTIVHVTKKYDQ